MSAPAEELAVSWSTLADPHVVWTYTEDPERTEFTLHNTDGYNEHTLVLRLNYGWELYLFTGNSNPDDNYDPHEVAPRYLEPEEAGALVAAWKERWAA